MSVLLSLVSSFLSMCVRYIQIFTFLIFYLAIQWRRYFSGPYIKKLSVTPPVYSGIISLFLNLPVLTSIPKSTGVSVYGRQNGRLVSALN